MTFLFSYLFALIIPVVGTIITLAFLRRQGGVYFRENTALRSAYAHARWKNFYLPLAVECAVGILLVTITAGPVVTKTQSEVSKKGIDIVLVFDISKSMLAEDIAPNRIGMAKKVVSDFISRFTSDRIGLVLFAGKPFLGIPLTFDYTTLVDTVEHITTDSIQQQVPGLSGTAIGDGLLVAIDTLTGSGNAIKSGASEAKREHVVILLTDGEANMGVNPRIVAKLAQEKKVKIYTIGIGNPEGTELYVTDSFWNRQYFRDQNGNPIKATLDEKMLTDIAETTGGAYYNARDEQGLSSVFNTLWKLTKTEVQTSVIRIREPRYEPFLIAILGLIPLATILRRRWE